ncbi:redoxin family protein [Calycomorphotria hydatis]|uniref:Thioredoxin domain-containing protein n=1 Tax=Calycomorphotria hydatis TaxID=2528027 RepID=A0A517T3M4_9PLAN|nr:redoxin family protein [Calycomorphotria hydatis]QDT62975.1 hypothetical protein V22_01730 [Calycomorphotria hydatis]
MMRKLRWILSLFVLNAFVLAVWSPGHAQLEPAKKTTNKSSLEFEADDFNDAPVRRGPKELKPGERNIGRKIADTQFRTIDDRGHQLSDFSDKQAIVIATTSTSCPLSRKYLPSLIELSNQYSKQGVQFLFLNPRKTDDAADMNRARKALGNNAVYIHDPNGELASLVGMTTTTDVVVLNPNREVVFQGAIDDQYGFGYIRAEPERRYLANAIDALLSDEAITVAATDAPGCLLRFSKKKPETPQVTYHNQVARLVNKHCVECHRDGGVAPFSLTSFDDVSAHASMIRNVIQRGVMPPWFAEEPEGVASPWANDRSLTDEEIALFANWIETGMTEGDPADAPASPEYPGGWLIGQPDAVFEFDEPIAVKADGVMPYQWVSIKTNLPEDKWIQSIEIRPGDPSVVHHVLVFVQRGDAAVKFDERAGFWAAYVPGNSTLNYPEGYAKLLPKGATLRFQMHYTPNGYATEDSTQLGLVFADEPPKHEVQVASIVNPRISIPPGAEHHEETATITVPRDVEVLAFLPHMHLRGAAARYDLLPKDGPEQTLLDVPHYDFNWQLIYRLAEPLLVKQGDVMKFTAWYDNSANNPANPDPTKTVRWGPQTYHEMHLGYVEYVIPDALPGETIGTRLRGRPGELLRNVAPATVIDRFDTDGDELISRKEMEERLGKRRVLINFLIKRLDSNGDEQIDREELEKLAQLRKN